MIHADAQCVNEKLNANSSAASDFKPLCFTLTHDMFDVSTNAAALKQLVIVISSRLLSISFKNASSSKN